MYQKVNNQKKDNQKPFFVNNNKNIKTDKINQGNNIWVERNRTTKQYKILK